MSNLDDSHQLGKGWKAWNKWREDHPGRNPDFRCDTFEKFDFRRMNLKGVDFERAELTGALFGVDLRGSETKREDLHGPVSKQSFIDKLLDAKYGTPAVLEHADLSDANLPGANLGAVNLDEAILWRADLTGAMLFRASLRRAELREAFLTDADFRESVLTEADLRDARLSGAKLCGADLKGANLSGANLEGADLSGADLEYAVVVGANLTGACLTGCRVYGLSAWGLKLDGNTKQQDLVITSRGDADVTADDIEVAQFLYLMLHNEKLKRVIDTITTKVVLILGCFSVPERKSILDSLREELRKPGRGYVPVVFDFEKPRSQTSINTVVLLARMARFVIADVSDAKSVLQELQAIVPESPKLPVQPIIFSAQEEPGMFDSFEAYHWFLKAHRYDGLAQLIAQLDERVIAPAEAKAVQLRT
jgi:uncharacterized protein YjbI with pentapeptide repeats